MEKEGYDVSYISTLDTHTDRVGLRRSRELSSQSATTNIGRSQCLTTCGKAVDAGMHAAFFSGDTCWCVIPIPSQCGRCQKYRTITRQGIFGPLDDEAETP